MSKKKISSQKSISTKSNKRENLLAYGVILILTLILYSNTFNHQYALDDAIVITDNDFTQEGISGIDDILFKETFTGFFGVQKNLVSGGRYRPFSLITFALEIEFFGENPTISHIINVLLYALTGIFLYLVLSKLFINFKQRKWYLSIPFLATLLFIAHPIHTEVIANIKGRDEIFALMFALIAWLNIINYSDTEKVKHLFYALIFFFLGMLSKEITITFLAVIPMSLFFFRRSKFIPILLSLLPLIVSSSVFLIMRSNAIGSVSSSESTDLMNNPFLNATISDRYATIFYTWSQYVKLLIFPHPLTYDYYPKQIPILNWKDVSVILSFLFFVAIGIISVIRGITKRDVISFAVLFYLITFSPVSNLLFPIGVFMNERFVYISSMGFVLILSYLLVEKLPVIFKSISKYNTVLISVVIVILGLYTIKTISRNNAWENDFTLFETDVKTSANSAKSNTSYGGKLIELSSKINVNTASSDSLKLREEYLKSAITHLEKAIEIYPKYNDAYLLLGNAHFELSKDIDKTMECYLKIIKRSPSHFNAHRNIEIVIKQLKDVDKQIFYYNEILKININKYYAHYQLGLLYGEAKGNIEMSVKHLTLATKLKPDSGEAYKALGVAYGTSQNFEESIKNFTKAMQLDPSDAQIKQNLGVTCKLYGANLFNIEKDYLKALEMFKMATELIPEDPACFNNLALTYQILGDKVKADEYFKHAQVLINNYNKKKNGK